MAVTLSCHCGGSRLRIERDPREAKVCNCTFCARLGAVRSYYAPEEVEIVSAEHDVVYAPRGFNLHHFCGRCGCHMYGDTPDWASAYNEDGTPKDGQAGTMPKARVISINMRMAQDFDLDGLPVIEMDGRNAW